MDNRYFKSEFKDTMALIHIYFEYQQDPNLIISITLLFILGGCG